MFRSLLCLITLTGLCACRSSQQSKTKFTPETKLIPRAAFFNGEKRNDFKLSPSGSHVFYRNNRSANVLYVYDIKQQLTDSVVFESPVVAYKTTMQGQLVVTEGEGGEQLFLNQKEILLDQVSTISLLSDENSKQQIAVRLNSEDADVSGIYALNLLNQKWKKLYEQNDYSQVMFNDDLKLTAVRKNEDDGGVGLYYVSENGLVSLSKVPWTVDMLAGGFTRLISVSKDGSRIFYTSNEQSDKSKVYRYSVNDSVSTLICEDGQVDIIPFAFSLDSLGAPESVVGLFGQVKRHVLDEKSKADFEILESKFAGDVSFVQASNDHTKWLVRELTGTPTKYYLYDRRTQSLDYLLSDYPALEPFDLAKRYNRSVIVRDGLELPIQVYLPHNSDSNKNGVPDKPLPTIVYVHGGPWMGLQWNSHYACCHFQLLANRGYAVINCEFRGTTGLGKRVTEKAYKKWGSDMTNDIADIAQWGIDNGISVSDKVGIWGWSYGGYAALAGPAFHPDLYACGVSMYGIGDLKAFCESDFAQTNLWRYATGDVSKPEDVDTLIAHSPINHVSSYKAPILLTTGSLDRRVLQSQVDDMAEALEFADKNPIYMYYPNEGHDYGAPETWMSFWSITEQFLAMHLGGQYEAAGNDPEKSRMTVVYGQNFIGDLK